MTEVTHPTSSLAQIRALMPDRPLTTHETRQIIERQTTRLLKFQDVNGPAVPVEQMVGTLGHIELLRVHELISSGATQWAGDRWLMVLDGRESPNRQRFTMGHELGHIVFHGMRTEVLPPYRDVTSADRLEICCNYFAACLLMPRPWMKRAYAEGLQSVPDLARLFGVSWEAMHIRLEQLGLVTPMTTYFRSVA